jgi:hypothetical protein
LQTNDKGEIQKVNSIPIHDADCCRVLLLQTNDKGKSRKSIQYQYTIQKYQFTATFVFRSTDVLLSDSLQSLCPHHGMIFEVTAIEHHSITHSCHMTIDLGIKERNRFESVFFNFLKRHSQIHKNLNTPYSLLHSHPHSHSTLAKLIPDWLSREVSSFQNNSLAYHQSFLHSLSHIVTFEINRQKRHSLKVLLSTRHLH